MAIDTDYIQAQAKLLAEYEVQRELAQAQRNETKYKAQLEAVTALDTALKALGNAIKSFKGADNSQLSMRELAMAFPGQAGSQLNLREIEQAIDQLNRLPSNQAHMELTPGSAVGGSSVLVKNDPQKPWRASLSRNNDGQKSTGEQQWGTGFEWDSPLGLADQLVLRGGHDAISDHQKASKNAMLYYDLP